MDGPSSPSRYTASYCEVADALLLEVPENGGVKGFVSTVLRYLVSFGANSANMAQVLSVVGPTWRSISGFPGRFEQMPVNVLAFGLVAGATIRALYLGKRWLRRRRVGAPKILSKYCPAGRIDVLKGRCIRFTQETDLNDVFEMKPPGVAADPLIWARACEELERLNPGLTWRPPAPSTSERQERSHDVLRDVLVLCVSAEWDIIPMWAYYTDSNKGFVIGFDAETGFFSGDLKEVKYADSRPAFKGGPGDFDAAIYTKSKYWNHEHEWRDFRILGKDRPIKSFPPSDDPHLQVHLFKFNSKAVAEVTLGNRMSNEHRSAMIRILHHPDYEHVTIWQAMPSINEFELRRERLTRKPDLYHRLEDISEEWDQFTK